MTVSRVEVLVEELSMEAALRILLPKILGDVAFGVYTYACKDDLLKRLPERLRGYASWLPEDWRIVVLVDRDDDDCKKLKARLEKMAADAGLSTRSKTKKGTPVSIVNRPRDRGARGLVLRGLGSGEASLSEGPCQHPDAGEVSLPRRHPWGNMGSLRAGLESEWILQDRASEDRSRASDRNAHGSHPQHLAQFLCAAGCLGGVGDGIQGGSPQRSAKNLTIGVGTLRIRPHPTHVVTRAPSRPWHVRRGGIRRCSPPSRSRRASRTPRRFGSTRRGCWS